MKEESQIDELFKELGQRYVHWQMGGVSQGNEIEQDHFDIFEEDRKEQRRRKKNQRQQRRGEVIKGRGDDELTS